MRAVLLLLATIAPLLTTAFPPYAERIPNANIVPDNDGGPGPCRAVGHLNCNGGGDRNQFGIDFADAGYQWTVELCKLDSDGDGLTNGQELGDPCCVWSPGSDVALSSEVSHPGSASSALPSARNLQECVDAPEPESPPPDSGSGSFWQEGEEQLTQTVTFNVTVSPNETSYVDILYSFDFKDNETVSLVGFDSFVDQNAGLLHHVVIHGCPFSLPYEEYYNGAVIPEDIQSYQPPLPYLIGCPDQLWVFVPGMDPFKMPEDVAFRVGAGTPYRSFVAQIHYWNPTGAEGVVDESSLTLHYTPNERRHAAAIYSFGSQLLNFQELPGGEPSYGYSSRCVMQTSEDATVFSTFPHMHLVGRRLWTETIARGVGVSDNPEVAQPATGEPLALLIRDDAFVYDLPNQYNVPNFTIRNGDLIATTCVFDTSDGPVTGGYATAQEMCINFAYYYPASAMEEKSCNHFSTLADSHSPFSGPWKPELVSVVQEEALFKAMLAPSEELGTFPTNGPEGSFPVTTEPSVPPPPVTTSGDNPTDDSHAAARAAAPAALLLVLSAILLLA